MVPVLDENDIPLMPCSEKRARKMMESGKAKAYWQHGFFCVKLVVEPSARHYQDVALGIDPGSKREGYTVLTETQVVINITTDTPDQVKAKVETRKNLRRNRRQRKTPYRKCRANRSSLKNKGVPPSTKARWDKKLTIIRYLTDILPITKINVEDISARTKPGDKRWNRSFSPLEVGKVYFYETVEKTYPDISLSKTKGFETKTYRDYREFQKSKKKLDWIWEAHNVDSHCLAEMMFENKVKPYRGLLGLKWMNFSRRQLHVQVPIKGGIRKPYGKSITQGIPKGMICKYVGKIKSCNSEDLYYIGGESKGKVTLHNYNGGKRASQMIDINDLILMYISKYSNNKLYI